MRARARSARRAKENLAFRRGRVRPRPSRAAASSWPGSLRRRNGMKPRGELGGAGDARHGALGIGESLSTTRSAASVESTTRSRNASATVSVRRATLADLPTIVELRLALLRENGDHPVYGQLRTDARERA